MPHLFFHLILFSSLILLRERERSLVPQGFGRRKLITFNEYVQTYSGKERYIVEIPTKQISGKINKIHYTHNPILVIISDGTTWKLDKKSWDFLKNQGKELKEGKTIQMELYLDGTVKNINLS